MKKKPSLADLARKTGVSKAAASYALRGLPGVSAETRKRVLAEAEKCGYYAPSRLRETMSSIRLRKDLRGMIALLLTDHDKPEVHENWRGCVDGICEQATRLGYTVDRLEADSINLSRIGDILRARGADGVLLLAPMSGRHRLMELGIRNDIAQVAIGPARMDALDIPIVEPDLVLAGRMVLVQAAWRGYRRIALFQPPTTFDPEQRFLMGCLQAMDDLPELEVEIFPPTQSRPASPESIQTQDFDCVITSHRSPKPTEAGNHSSDPVRETGWIQWKADRLSPDITGVDWQDELLGAEAVNLLHDKINEKRSGRLRPPCTLSMRPAWVEGRLIRERLPVLSPTHRDRPFRVKGKQTVLDLRPWGTRSLNEKYGWFHDLRTPGLSPGTYRLHGVDIRLFPEEESSPRAVIILGNNKEGDRLPTAVRIPVGRRSKEIFLLLTTHAGSHCGVAGRCTLHFADGSSTETLLKAPPHPNKESVDPTSEEWTVADWWPACIPPDNDQSHPVPVTGFNELYLTTAMLSLLRIKNPDPSQPVEEISFEVEQESGATLAVFAVTL